MEEQLKHHRAHWTASGIMIWKVFSLNIMTISVYLSTKWTIKFYIQLNTIIFISSVIVVLWLKGMV